MLRWYDCRTTERVAGLAAVRRGELVVVPTDTVYGLAADPAHPAAVGRLLRAKGRGRAMPSPVLIGSAAAVTGVVSSSDQDR
ncbi:L-threonylcarbamoyladenylate synthase [Nocardia thailandica]